MLINDMSCFMSGVVDGRTMSRDAYKALKKMGVLDPETGELYTRRIDRNFSHGMAVVPLNRQRMIVGLLFHWEEEMTRWRLLDEEEAEIRKAMDVDRTRR